MTEYSKLSLADNNKELIMAAKIFIVQLPEGRSSLGKLVSLTCLKSRFSWIHTIGVDKVHKNLISGSNL